MTIPKCKRFAKLKRIQLGRLGIILLSIICNPVAEQYKHIIPIFLFTLATLWPVASSATTQTTSFTLSVTIPQRAGIDQTAVPAYLTSNEPQTLQPAYFQTETATRDDQLVLVRSYVVN